MLFSTVASRWHVGLWLVLPPGKASGLRPLPAWLAFPAGVAGSHLGCFVLFHDDYVEVSEGVM